LLNPVSAKHMPDIHIIANKGYSYQKENKKEYFVDPFFARRGIFHIKLHCRHKEKNIEKGREP